MSILEVKNLSHNYGDKQLFQNTGLQLNRGDKMGLTGLNGAGKTTFINILTGTVSPDAGSIKWHPKIRVGYLDQHAAVDETLTVRAYLSGAFADLFETERQLNELNEAISVCTDEDELYRLCTRAGAKQELLESRNFYAVDSEIDKIAAGLGLTAFGMDTKLGHLSGGQRAKVMLARMFLEVPDVLILDEPTNFLDQEHIEWLTKYLTIFKGSFIVVSHDFAFLNRVVNCISDIEFGVITRYNGNFESFQRQKESRREEYIKNYHAQQKEIGKLEEYIQKNLTRASTSAMAKSRRKKLEKMQVMEKPVELPVPTFLFEYTPPVGKTALWVNDLQVGYGEPLLPEINLVLKLGEKIAVTGFNGIGKSTFLKTICGLLPPLSGAYRYPDKLKIGYYEQENNWEHPDYTPFQELKESFPRLSDKQVRGHLARCGLRQEHIMQKLSTLSGGEQSKVKLCKLTLSPYNLLILDEPTNHLDVNAVAQLKTAIRSFEGSVIFVSHSKEFCAETADWTFDFESLFD